MPFNVGFDRPGEITYVAGKNAGQVIVKGYDPNTGTITWQSPLGFMGKTKLSPEESRQYMELATPKKGFEETSLGRAAGLTPNNVAAVQAGQTDVDPTAAQHADIDARIQKYLDEVSKPLDMNDPYVQSIVQAGAHAAATTARNQGIQGGLSAQASAQGAQGQMTALEGQRRQMQAGALGLASQRDLSLRGQELGLQQLQEQRYQFDQDMAGQQNAAGQQRAAGKGALIGGIIGAIPGVIAAPYTSGASLRLVGAGSAIGAGVAGANYKPPSTATRSPRSLSTPGGSYG